MTIRLEIEASNAAELMDKLRGFGLGATSAPVAYPTVPHVRPTPETLAEDQAKRAAPVEEAEQANDAAPEQPPPRRRRAKVIEGEVAPEPKATPAAITPDAVRAVLNRLRTERGNDTLGAVVTMFAPKFSEIPETSYPALHAAALKALA